LKFSIIIPARNEEGYLARTLKSVEEQDYPNYETIVVANGCTDNTAAVAARYADKVYSLRQPGVSRARNFGAARAKGDVLVFLDADTFLGPGVLQEIKKNFALKYSVGTIKVRPNRSRLKYKTMMKFKNLVNGAGLYPWMAGAVFCRKDDFAGFDENLNVKETIYFLRKMMRRGEFLFINRAHVTTSMRRYEKWGSLELVMFFIKKWFKSFFSNVKGDDYPLVR